MKTKIKKIPTQKLQAGIKRAKPAQEDICIHAIERRNHCSGMQAGDHAAFSGYKSPDKEISGYLSMICLASCLDTSLCPFLILRIKTKEHPFSLSLALLGPPTIFKNLSNSSFMLFMIHYVALQTQALLLQFVSTLNTCPKYNYLLIFNLIINGYRYE